MTLKDMEAALEADWENVVAFFHNLFHKVPASPVSAPDPVVAHPSTPVEVAPVTPANVAPVETGSDNWLTRDIAGQATPQAPAGPDTSPVVDTSGATLDFEKVRSVGVNLTGEKRIEKCPASVTVAILQSSGQSGASNTYMATVNGVVSGPYQTAGEQKFPAQGPVVTVSVDSPGLQMLIS